MNWLHSVDLALFHFINSTLENPFFDWLMPALSGYTVPWLPALLLVVVWIVIRGTARLRLCVLLGVLIVSLGDPFIIGNIKHTIQRPRPFVTVPDARHYLVDTNRFKRGAGYVAVLPNGTLPTTSNLNSMPSAHAANWFSFTAIAFIFYRRSLFYLLPLATSIALSRVYNGVHYPADVSVGALLGAFYGAASVYLLQWLWAMLGSRLAPKWHQRLPNLIHPEATIQTELGSTDKS